MQAQPTTKRLILASLLSCWCSLARADDARDKPTQSEWNLVLRPALVHEHDLGGSFALGLEREWLSMSLFFRSGWLIRNDKRAWPNQRIFNDATKEEGSRLASGKAAGLEIMAALAEAPLRFGPIARFGLSSYCDRSCGHGWDGFASDFLLYLGWSDPFTVPPDGGAIHWSFGFYGGVSLNTITNYRAHSEVVDLSYSTVAALLGVMLDVRYHVPKLESRARHGWDGQARSDKDPQKTTQPAAPEAKATAGETPPASSPATPEAKAKVGETPPSAAAPKPDPAPDDPAPAAEPPAAADPPPAKG